MSMDETSSTFGVFPVLLEPARCVAKQLVASPTLTTLPLPEHPGLSVTRKRDAAALPILFEFEEGSEQFVLHE